MSVYKKKPSLPPPSDFIGIGAWVRHNLFASKVDGFLTIVSFALLIWVIPPIIDWAFVSAIFSGDKAQICYDAEGRGACWVFIKEKFYLFMFGFYPDTQVVRLILTLPIVVFTYFGVKYIKPAIGKIVLLIASPLVCLWLFYGGFGLEVVTTDKWGGLSLTVFVATVGIVCSFPIGVVLSLGRKSKMPVIRTISIIYIEVIRGVPLITILFMASVILPMFFPENMTFDKLLRALIGITLFQSAYIAEVVRGGLQALPKGQYEASDAIGLTYWQSMVLVILPQALKISIPNLVGSSISLLKDTTLVLIIGLFDVLGIVWLSSSDSEWLGFDTEGYVFVAFVFWVICFSMSKYSKAIEDRFNTENRGK